MKSNEEFIAGIYQKAELRKMENRSDEACGRKERRPRLYVWQGLAAAACVCFLISGAVYAGRMEGAKDRESDAAYLEQNPQKTEDSGLMTASEDGGMRGRTVAEKEMQARTRGGYDAGEPSQLVYAADFGFMTALEAQSLAEYEKDKMDTQKEGGR